MKKSNIIISSILISTLLANVGYCAKKSQKSVKPSLEVSENKGELYVFPVESEKQEYNPVERVLTGIFTQKQQKKAVEDEKNKSLESSVIKKKELPPRKLNEKTIAWVNPISIYYHDPLNNCLNTEERNWAEDKKELIGLEPCPDCFKKRDMIPAFIKKECGNLDIANANDLMVNSKFVEWAKERLPVKEIVFISGMKLMVYPTLDMTSKGLYQLTKEVQLAYLRQTWRVIEVQAKSDSDSIQYVSSSSEEAVLLGEIKDKEENQERYTTMEKVTKDLKTSLKGAVQPSRVNKSNGSSNKKGRK